MKITALSLDNVRGFQSLSRVDFSESINILIGPNNSGKSTILNAIFLLQRRVLNSVDMTIGASQSTVDLWFKGRHLSQPLDSDSEQIKIDLVKDSSQFVTRNPSQPSYPLKSTFPETEPNNLIYPYLSKRKVGSYTDSINEANAISVIGNFTHLYTKIDRLVTPQFQPANSQYIKACNEILGFEVSTLAKGNGKHAVYFVHNLEHIPLTSMGEGVANILGLIVDLCIAENKLFLIEEPENDIHPKALKALLRLIVEKSNSNQFFVSTHSNIVMKYLGAAEGSKIFKVSNDEFDETKPKLRKSVIQEVPNTPYDRQKVLEELGYEFFDLDLWKAWLFLEESSAEVIIRDHLIKWFIPELKYKLRTFSAGSTSQIESKFDDFNRLFVFLHLEPTYKNRVWVYIDAGEKEEKIVSDMRLKYETSGWNESNFSQFSEHDFEKYYPPEFQEEVSRVLSIANKKEKRTNKKFLLDNVKVWIRENEEKAKEEFRQSAKEIIEILQSINVDLEEL
jgi:predicted ATPase